MRRAFITVFFVGCFGSVVFHAMAGRQERTTHNISNLPSQIETSRVNVSTNVSTLVQAKEISSNAKKSNDATVDSVPTEGRGSATMVAV